jgi:putative ABC transport system permease protein
VVRNMARRAARVRTLVASPMFTLTAVLSLAIGIGGTTVIFGVADTYLIRPWPGIADPDQLVEVGRIDMPGPGPYTGDGFSTFSYPNYQDYLARQSVFQSFAASRIGDAVGLGDGTRASRVSGAYVTTNFFSVLGTPIALGRRPAAHRTSQRRHHQPSSLALAVRR